MNEPPEARVAPLILDFLKMRLEMGIEKSGLYNYYKAHLDLQIAFNNYDLATFDFLTNKVKPFERCIEVGAGIGQLPILFAMRGLATVAVESNKYRFEAMCDLFSQLEGQFAKKPDVVFGRFPRQFDANLLDRGALMIFTNLVTAEKGIDQQMLSASVNCGGIIVDLARFGQSRTMPEQWQELTAHIEAAGFEPPISVYSHGEPNIDPSQRNAIRIVYFGHKP